MLLIQDQECASSILGLWHHWQQLMSHTDMENVFILRSSVPILKESNEAHYVDGCLH